MAAPSYERVVRQFEAISFSDEGGNFEDSFNPWRIDPVFIYLPDTELPDTPDYRSLVERIIVQLRAFSGLAIRLMPRDKANVFIRFASSDCEVDFSDERVDVTITTTSRLGTVHCLYEELAQTIGPADDACHYRPSIFCDLDFPQAYTEVDRIILRATFDPRLRNGMTRAQGMPIARRIIRELYEETFGPIPEPPEAAPVRPDLLGLP